jgi:hypothetical protein
LPLHSSRAYKFASNETKRRINLFRTTTSGSSLDRITGSTAEKYVSKAELTTVNIHRIKLYLRTFLTVSFIPKRNTKEHMRLAIGLYL